LAKRVCLVLLNVHSIKQFTRMIYKVNQCQTGRMAVHTRTLLLIQAAVNRRG
jgi:hypothetical protein